MIKWLVCTVGKGVSVDLIYWH